MAASKRYSRGLGTRRRLGRITCLSRSVVFAILISAYFSGVGTCSENSRIRARPGIAVIKTEEFYDDKLATSVLFDVIEDRTAADNPNWGYYLFRKGGRSVQAKPKAVRLIVYFDELNARDIAQDRMVYYAKVADDLRLASGFNETVATALRQCLERSEAIAENLKSGSVLVAGKWLSREEQIKQLGKSESAPIQAAASSISLSIKRARSHEDLEAAREDIEVSVRKAQATTSESVAERAKIALSLEQELSARVKAVELEVVRDSCRDVLREIRSAQNKAALDDVPASIAKVGALPAHAPETAVFQRESVAALQSELSLRSNALGLADGGFQTMEQWAAAIEALKPSLGSEGSDPAAKSLLEANEKAYSNCKQMQDLLRKVDQEFGAFLSSSSQLPQGSFDLPALTPPLADAAEKLGGFDPAKCPLDLGRFYNRVRSEISLYAQLQTRTSKDRRNELFQSFNDYQPILSKLGEFGARLTALKSSYDENIRRAKEEEAASRFGDAESYYRKAGETAPSDLLSKKVQEMKDQNLGL